MASEKKKNSTIYTPDNLKGEVSVFILYPGIPVTCSLGNKLNLPAQKNIGEIYMPPSVKAGVPDWFDKYVMVFPHTHTQPYGGVKNEVNEVLSAKGLTLKSLNVGIFSGSGNLSIPATEKLSTLLVMDTIVGGNTEANTTRVLKEGGKVFCMFGPSNWGGSPRGYGTDYWKKVWGKLNTEDWGEINQKTYKTFGFPPDGSSGCGQQIWHMVMPQYFLKYFKSKIEAAQAPTTNNQVAQNTQQTQQTQQTQNTQTNNNQNTNNQPSNQQPAPQTPEPSPSRDWTMGTQSQPFNDGTYNFNVERKNFFVIPNLGELRLVTEEELKKLGRVDLGLLDEEYLETAYMGEDELAVEIEKRGEVQKEAIKDVPEEVPKPATGGSDSTGKSTVDFKDTKYTGGPWKNYNIDKLVTDIGKTKFKPPQKFTESLKKVLLWMKTDDRIKEPKDAAYLLGTAFAESSYSLQRWEADDVCKSRGLPYGSNGPCQAALNWYKKSVPGKKKDYYALGIDSRGFPYFGRGLIQLTGKGGYEQWGKKIGVDLVGNGDLALNEANSYAIAVAFLTRKNGPIVFAKKGNLTEARRRVNGGKNGLEEVNGAYEAWTRLLTPNIA